VTDEGFAIAGAHPHRALHERDRDRPFRVTLLADRWPRSDSTTERAVAMLIALDPSIRVTLAAAEIVPADAADLEAWGVEVLPAADARWLASRSGHPSVLMVDGPAAALPFLGSLDAHPGAVIVYDLRGPGTGEHAVDRRVESQVVALSSVVLVPSPAHVPFARDLSGGGDAVVADPAEEPAALAQAFALTGLAVPDAALA
jgi:hypothetical protein